MALKSKLDLLNLSEEERVKVQTKFLATLSLISEKELKDELDFLSSKGVRITKAKEIKVLAEPVANLVKKFSILSEIHEEEIFVQDPSKLARNAIDIYKKVNYCKQVGKVYKKEDGTYEHYLSNEKDWNKEFNKENELVIDSPIQTIEEDITLESSIAPEIVSEPVVDNIVSFNDYVEPQVIEEAKENDFEKTIRLELDGALNDDLIHQDVTKFTDDIEEKTEAQIINFQQAKSELEDLKSQLAEISFNDLEPETYGMGRVAWSF